MTRKESLFRKPILAAKSYTLKELCTSYGMAYKDHKCDQVFPFI